MRWNALPLLATVLILTAAGCQTLGFKTDAELQPPPTSTALSEDYYVPPPVERSPVRAEPQVDYSVPVEPAPTTRVADAYLSGYEPAPVAPRYHTVSKRDTLYSLARQYYGDQRRWKEIYEANRSEIRNPDLIMVGQRLLIP